MEHIISLYGHLQFNIKIYKLTRKNYFCTYKKLELKFQADHFLIKGYYQHQASGCSFVWVSFSVKVFTVVRNWETEALQLRLLFRKLVVFNKVKALNFIEKIALENWAGNPRAVSTQVTSVPWNESIPGKNVIKSDIEDTLFRSGSYCHIFRAQEHTYSMNQRRSLWISLIYTILKL